MAISIFHNENLNVLFKTKKPSNVRRNFEFVNLICFCSNKYILFIALNFRNEKSYLSCFVQPE